MSCLFNLQQMLMSISGTLAITLIAAKVICAGEDEEFVAYMLSSALFSNGICTILMNVIGVRYVRVPHCGCSPQRYGMSPYQLPFNHPHPPHWGPFKINLPGFCRDYLIQHSVPFHQDKQLPEMVLLYVPINSHARNAV